MIEPRGIFRTISGATHTIRIEMGDGMIEDIPKSVYIIRGYKPPVHELPTKEQFDEKKARLHA